MALLSIEIELSEDAFSQQVADWLVACRARIELYWDQFPQKPLPQYIECDFNLVASALTECVQRDLIDGRLFVEWGCGFGVVTGVAGILGLDAIGVEAEPFLCEEGRKLLKDNQVDAEIWQGNFLPRGAKRLAEDTDPLVSLTHDLEPAYDSYDMPLEDFAIVFAYPWPGEEHFLRLVFDRFARSGALLLMFRGPYHIELYRKR
ncbi:type 2 periplasmic-binding domain-containing protein [Aureliella helgolandensis]|uniref:Methyltransferase n=1 Tax=Aureliella helgolandensis TaxID=2527968 RepID=A0A518GBW1_9BACT|nr:class I SAM-dependent methyltransferase [Aureliella helgolandensis]QDV26102.1 hypothetical protein Q31a_44740 [Aureliella helgolandensis]